MNNIFESWRRLGVNFTSVDSSMQEPQVEKLVRDTLIKGRDEPRLLECMAAWLYQYGDLINISLMRNYVTQTDSAVFGFILELINHKRLNQLIKYCTPKKDPEMLFNVNSTIMKAEAVNSSSDINRKWNLYYVSFRIKNNAIMNRHYVLKNNPNLARRSLFGVSLKTEIINFILNNEDVYVAGISHYMGCHYHLVSSDIKEMIEDGIVRSVQYKRKNILEFIPSFRNYFCATPFLST